MYAANGIGCVLAVKGHIREARDVFAQVYSSSSIRSQNYLLYTISVSIVTATNKYSLCYHSYH